jgi:general secretion pathway protein H
MSATGSAPRGFSLIELLVALSVVALLSISLPWALDRWLPSRQLAATVSGFAQDLRTARLDALSDGLDRRLRVETEPRALRVTRSVDDVESYALPAQTEFSASLGGTGTSTSTSPAEIRFAADGSSSGGQWQFTRGAQRWVVELSALTGRVKVVRQ